MKLHTSRLFLFLCLVLCASVLISTETHVCESAFAAAQTQDMQPDLQKRLAGVARELIHHCAEGRYEEAVLRFDDTMKKASPPAKLRALWESLVRERGPFRAQGESRLTRRDPYIIVLTACTFERSSLDLRLVFDADEKITGMWLDPIFSPPPYADTASFDESEWTFGVKGWELPGTLTLPRGEGPHPVLILVHGSGPQDRDETIGPNKPFRDLAWGLASRGIAVFRYDKRTKVHGFQLLTVKEPFTVYQETVEDALEAAALMRQNPHIDPDRIFILGHSLGGMLVPRIGLADTCIAGFVIMAGAARPLEDLALDQIDTILSLQNEVSADEKRQLEAIRAGAARIKALKEGETFSGLIIGAPPSYWLDLKGYAPARVALSMKAPMLIVQGERDYQVTKKDFEIWKQALSARPDILFIAYPLLNHLFIAGEGLCTPSEYNIPGHVSEALVHNIATWMHAIALNR